MDALLINSVRWRTNNRTSNDCDGVVVGARNRLGGGGGIMIVNDTIGVILRRQSSPRGKSIPTKSISSTSRVFPFRVFSAVVLVAVVVFDQNWSLMISVGPRPPRLNIAFLCVCVFISSYGEILMGYDEICHPPIGCFL